ncbi:hypothetical protein Amn_pa01660 (plasmid) [Aminobacter sp. Y103A]|jgi:hypothetical protein|uniref:Uncharacterized protein n=2 Tax=Aminobacter aminovorans TaxID=83263 RepID=A0AAC8YUZ4_AMIAI|nr:hypothetical protein [Aminobacter niigataensis]AMS44569.1 hypothetical protein AA2016_5664 [Aminobacter aminovorans]BBD40712.1 hypothetical protein Amn_pa01660 [Aminobacter sp. SS-2016]
MAQNMTTSEHGAGFSAAAAAIAASAEEALASGTLDRVSEADIAVALTALGKLYATKVEKSDKIFPPVGQDALTATETAVLVSELLRAADLNVFDLAMWFRRAS